MIIFFGIWLLFGFITVAIVEIYDKNRTKNDLDFLYALLIIFLGFISVLILFDTDILKK